ncbi:MAG: FAD-dependent thymidylate synthase [Prevotellaceae bacterium]|jgi:thymidylate synthase (FAD)|nr:FAD-dependent thymidylate synthase [Prevotellaceae bacterium]
MKIIVPGFSFYEEIDGMKVLRNIEKAGRTCYKSEDKIMDLSAKKFVRNILKSGHESVIEHEKITVKIICDRGVSHEIVRHRIASYSQESTRYCNYTENKFGKELTLIRPFFWNDAPEKFAIWKETMQNIENNYALLISLGAKPEEARSILPNSLKTEIVVTMNLREWRHFFKLRTSLKAHPQMREIAVPLLKRFNELIPIIFDDLC